MSEKAIKLLKLRIQKLNSEDFDLEAWKAGTVGILKNLIGSDDPRIALIEELKVDYSSWALRDATSTYNPIESNKKKGKEVLNALIDEIDLLGIPSQESTNESVLKSLPEKWKEELSEAISQKDSERLKSLLKNEKKEELLDAFIKLLTTQH